MQDIKQAFRDVFPTWLALCAISLIWGFTMQVLPGFMEGQLYYPTDWAANLAHADPHTYQLVAEEGYGAEGRILQSSVRFPLYPLLIRVVSQVTTLDPNVSMFLISKAALLVGLMGIWLLLARFSGREQAERASVYLLFPLLGSGYTWLMSYPEALHLALWAMGFVLLYRREYLLCGLVTVLTVWSRPQAIVIVPAFALALVAEAVRERGLRGLLDVNLWLRGLLTCGLPLLAFTAWVLHVSALTEIPLSPFTAQQQYGRRAFMWPWVRFTNVLTRPFRSPPLVFSWEIGYEYYQYALILISLVILCVAAARKRLPWALVLFSVLSIVPGLSTGSFGLGRFALVTWIPLAAIYVVPRRYDNALVPIGIALSFLAFVVLGLTGGFVP